MFDVNDDVFTEEDFYLCKMFGEDCRFVEVSVVDRKARYNKVPIFQFFNQTGREILLTSRLEIERLPNQAWSTNINISPSQSHVWRFLGDSQHQSDQLSYLTILPEPWNLSRDNLFSWTARFADSTEEDSIMFDQKTDKLQLQALPELGPKERLRVKLSRKSTLVTSLRKLAADKSISHLGLDEAKIESMQIPR